MNIKFISWSDKMSEYLIIRAIFYCILKCLLYTRNSKAYVFHIITEMPLNMQDLMQNKSLDE